MHLGSSFRRSAVKNDRVGSYKPELSDPIEKQKINTYHNWLEKRDVSKTQLCTFNLNKYFPIILLVSGKGEDLVQTHQTGR